MTFAEADKGPEIPVLKRIEREVLIIKEANYDHEKQAREGNNQVGVGEASRPGKASSV